MACQSIQPTNPPSSPLFFYNTPPFLISATTSLYTFPSTLAYYNNYPYPHPYPTIMSSPSPPPPYSLQPPPYTRRQRKLPRAPTPPRPPRVSSRELLAEALNFAQRAVKLDLANADLPLAVAAYDEAISILQRVITRRSEKPGIMSEVERVTGIVSQTPLSLSLLPPLPSPPSHPLSSSSPLSFVTWNHERLQSRTIVHRGVPRFFFSLLFVA